MNEQIDPLSADEKRVLDLVAQFEPPRGAEQRVFESLKMSMAAAAPIAATAVTGMVAGKTAASIAGAMLIAGIGAGVLLGRTMLAPEPPPPTVIERVVRVEVPVPAVAAPQPAPVPVPVPAPTARKNPPVPEPLKADELLAREREQIDTARSALLHGDAAAAISALQAHAENFPKGRLDEERESLWVQALVMNGALPQAKAKAAQFHQKFPRSLLGPTVDAALVESP